MCPLAQSMMMYFSFGAISTTGGNALDTAYTQKVIQAMVEWVESQMLDYHLTLPEPQNMEGLLGLLVASASTEESRKELVMNCVASSLSRAFQRLVARVNDSEPTAALHTLAKQVEELFEVELRKYTKHLAPFCETAAAIAAQQLHNSYGQVSISNHTFYIVTESPHWLYG